MTDSALFASTSLRLHLLRGLGALAAGTAGVGLMVQPPTILGVLLAAGLLAAAALLLRGCPMCWTIGLIETIRSRAARSLPPHSGVTIEEPNR